MSFPPAPNVHTLAVLAITFLALILFTRNKIPLESSSLFVLISLAVGFELLPFQQDGDILHATDLFHGFGHEALVAFCALMIAGQGLLRTAGAGAGQTDRIVRFLDKPCPDLALLPKGRVNASSSLAPEAIQR
jgi:hypothetical protein